VTARSVRAGHPPADILGMTSTGSSASQLPAALARAAVVTPPPAQNIPSRGRHLAPDVPGTVRIAAPEDLLRTGRHAEPEWSRDLHDPRRDEVDSLSWLGFRPSRH
jgi:hypothetical protein